MVDTRRAPGKGEDVSDWLNAGGTAEKLARLVERTPEWEFATSDDRQGDTKSVQVPHSDVKPKFNGTTQEPTHMVPENPERHPAHRRTFTAAEVLDEELPELKWAVPGIVPEGVTLPGGKPKMGKSWLALGLCIATSTGGYALGKKRVEQGTCLYLALEDNRRRLQKRLRKLLPDGEAPEGLHIATEWPTLDQGGIEELRAWLDEHPDTRLVVVDTLKKVRPRGSGQRNVYDVDYEALEPLLPLAAKYEVAIVVVHHLRLMPAADPLDEISGSTGLTGAVDGALVIRRDRSSADACLHVTGRDIEEEAELALRWDRDFASWTLLGDAEEYRMSGERSEIYALLSKAAEPMSPKEVAEALGKSVGSVKMLLGEMLDDGQVKKPHYGKYTIPDSADSTDSAAEKRSGVSTVSRVSLNSMSDCDELGEEHRAENDASLAEKVRGLMSQDIGDGEY